jgi:hypothetical protein
LIIFSFCQEQTSFHSVEPAPSDPNSGREMLHPRILGGKIAPEPSTKPRARRERKIKPSSISDDDNNEVDELDVAAALQTLNKHVPGPVMAPASSESKLAALLQRRLELERMKKSGLGDPVLLYPKLHAIRTRKPVYRFGRKSTHRRRLSQYERAQRDLLRREALFAAAGISITESSSSSSAAAFKKQPFSLPSAARFEVLKDDKRFTHLIKERIEKPVRPTASFISRVFTRGHYSEDDADYLDDSEGDAFELFPQRLDEPRIKGGSFAAGYDSDTEAFRLKKMREQAEKDQQLADLRLAAFESKFWNNKSPSKHEQIRGVGFDKMRGRFDDEYEDSGLTSCV